MTSSQLQSSSVFYFIFLFSVCKGCPPSLSLHACMFVSMHMYVIYVCVWESACVHSCVCMYVCVYGCVCVCACMHMCVYSYGGQRWILGVFLIPYPIFETSSLTVPGSHWVWQMGWPLSSWDPPIYSLSQQSSYKHLLHHTISHEYSMGLWTQVLMLTWKVLENT